jgi:dihydropyrimidinase/dihydroorotase
MVDLIIKNGRIVTPSGVIHSGIAVAAGKITHIGSDTSLPQGKRVIDAKEQFVIPGFIDPHVHLSSRFHEARALKRANIPTEEYGTLEEGLRAVYDVETDGALHGGVTTMGVFAGSAGQPIIPEFETTRSVGEDLSYIDFFFHAIVSDENQLAEHPELARRGVTSFKHMFNAYLPRPIEQQSKGYLAPSNAELLFRSLEFVAKHGYPAIGMVHCEDIDIICVLEERLKETGRSDLAVWTEARPNFVEYMRIVYAFEIAKAVRAPLYIVHITTAEGVEFVAQKRKEGYPIWGETGPQWLTHTAEMEDEIGCWGKVNPPLKYARDNERLWQGIIDGGIHCMGTDHGTAGGTAKDKQAGGTKHNNIWDSRPGIKGGMEHWLPVMMTYGVNTGKISIEDMVRVCSTNVAKVFGLYPRKGVLSPGSDADIVLIDPDKETPINKDFYHCRAEPSIYDGWKVKGTASTTIIRGEVMMENYETVGEPKHGVYIPCRKY